jgi:hypothetical protein
MPKHRLNAIDLFAGIGGMSYALNDVCKTVAYCESDPHCCRVLEKNMRSGRIDNAIILPDVRKLQRKDLPTNDIDIVLAGFPCQDISMAGKEVGIHGKRSSLFKEVIRVVQELPSIKYLFLENVANIQHHGLEYVLRKIDQQGFSYVHGMFQANELKAPHKRMRWFLLAMRPCANDIPSCKIPRNMWGREPEERLIPYSKQNRSLCYIRYHMLGNSVVPQCAALAWNTLSQVLLNRDVHHVKRLADPAAKERSVPVHMHLPDTKSSTYRVSHMHFLKRPVQLPVGTRNLWGTPTAARWNQYRSYTSNRAFTNLANQIFYDARTQRMYNRKRTIPARDLSKAFDIDPNFIEWMMGYPKNWTAG